MSFAYALDDRIATLTIDDGKVNAMSLPFFRELTAALERATADDAGALIITGRPGAYSAGLNLKLLPTLPADELKETLVEFGRTMMRLFTCPVPTVAAISGHAIAGGAFLGLACDLRVMVDGPFKMHINEVVIGLTVPTWAIAIAENAMDVPWRTEAILLARPYTPAEVLARRFIHELCLADQLLPRARALATPLLALNRKSYAATKLRQRVVALRHAESVLADEMVGLPVTQTRG